MKYVPDLMLIAGVSSMSYGAWSIYQPAGFILGGLLVTAWAIKAAK